MIRHEYLVDRSGYRPSQRPLSEDLVVREPTEDDRLGLASLMMDAYVGTIDYHGETYEQAVEEVDGAFRGEARLALSRLALLGDEIQSAVLVSRYEDDAFIGYVMTRAKVKNRGLASALLDVCMAAIWESGYKQVRCFITEGNTPSEHLFTRGGFAVIGTTSTD